VFQKRSQKTAHADRGLGKGRYVDLMKWRREEGL
jgi:phage-related protein